MSLRKNGSVLRSVGFASFLLFFAASQSACRLSANFHEVERGVFYRSAQLYKGELETAFQKLGIKTVINLRGEAPGKGWYKDEIEVSEKYGVRHISIGMSASRLPHRSDLIKLLDALRDSPRPILIHCKAGADRAGEASALYMLEYMGKSKKKALKMLTPKYLHLPAFMPAKTYFIKHVYQGEEWARLNYNPCNTQYKYYDRTKYCKETFEGSDEFTERTNLAPEFMEEDDT